MKLKSITYYSLLLLVAIFITSCSSNKNKEDKPTTLKDIYKNDFQIGTALNHPQIMGKQPEDLEVVKKAFNAVTPENIMKWELIHPEPGQYNFAPADSMVNFCETHDIFVIGHTLVWHSQTPDWVFQNAEGDTISRDSLLQRMKAHIHKVAGRYKGRIDGWDVVNEAVNGDGTLRQSPWLKIIGEDYLVKAFEYAREAAPEAELYYNDYSLNNPEKRDGVVRMVRRLKEKGAPIDGIGMQAHYGLDYPPKEQIQASIDSFASLDVKVMITELDINVLPNPEESEGGADISEEYKRSDKFDPYQDGLPDSMQTRLAARYKELFELFMKNKDKISRVSFWGVNDAQSWKNNWPIQGRTNYPLIFDRQNQPKAAYDSIFKVGE